MGIVLGPRAAIDPDFDVLNDSKIQSAREKGPARIEMKGGALPSRALFVDASHTPTGAVARLFPDAWWRP
jgi:hypothetical protein